MSNVNSTQFGKIGVTQWTADGRRAPLFANMTVGGKTTQCLYVATEHDRRLACRWPRAELQMVENIDSGAEKQPATTTMRADLPEIGITINSGDAIVTGANGISTWVMIKTRVAKYTNDFMRSISEQAQEIAAAPPKITASYPGDGGGSSGGNVMLNPGQ